MVVSSEKETHEMQATPSRGHLDRATDHIFAFFENAATNGLFDRLCLQESNDELFSWP